MHSLTFYHPRALGPAALGLAAISSPNAHALRVIAMALRMIGYKTRMWKGGKLAS